MANSQKNSRHSISGTYAHCKMGCWRGFKLLPVLLIVSIVVWSYYAYVYQLCFLTIESMVQKIIYLILYHILLIMFAWSYWRTIFAEIKTVPDKFKLPEEELQKLLNSENEEAQRIILENFARDLPIVTRTTNGLIRYCNRCVLIKPDRAHHCSICHQCVLKMDHHCPWVNNCVCYFNYKFFMLFLGYALMYCFYIMATCLPFFIMFWKEGGYVLLWLVGGEFGPNVPVERYHIMFEFFVALMFGISLASLFGYHCYLVANNRTTIDEIAWHSRRRGPSGYILKSMLDSIGNEAFRAPTFRGGADKNGFSIGFYKNLKQIFGNDPKLWLLPVFTSIGDGTDYPVRPEHSLQTFTTQPDLTYESMGTTRPSIGDGVAYPLPHQEEDTESLLSSERWDRWGERSRPFDERESSSFDEL